jgi:hypothetical protein
MNSHQRRKDRRRFAYTVETEYINYDHYAEMWDWLKDNYGCRSDTRTAPWREQWLTIGTNWQFADSKTATAFAMKWK